MGRFSIPGLSDAVAPSPLVSNFPAVDTFTLASFQMPGKWTLLSATKQFGWQIQQGAFENGAGLIPKGDPLIVAKFRGEIWAPQDFELFKAIRSQFLTKPAVSLGVAVPATAAMGIDHPELKALGMTACVMHDIDPAIQEEGGLWVIHVSFLQYLPPAPALPRTKASIPAVAPPTPNARDAAEIEQAKLMAEIDAKKAKLAR